MGRTYSRRRFIQEYFTIASAVVGVAGIAGACKQKQPDKTEGKTAGTVDACNDFSGVSENDRKAREKLGYVNESPIEDMTCNKCNLWLPREDNKQCGGCMLFKGPVFATGYCTYWTAKQA